ncbi:hypothetical protein [Streptomyces sp. NBC_01794]|uniref:hypothetical protein n=1 Tax=unclassified Streptomyces TaxID=2593676 RepID=UPI0038730705
MASDSRIIASEDGQPLLDDGPKLAAIRETTLLEAFADDAAAAAHVQSDHFTAGLATMAAAIAETPEIINVTVPDQHG